MRTPLSESLFECVHGVRYGELDGCCEECRGGFNQPPVPRRTINDARQKIAGWHFAKESLSDGEREILLVAERLMRVLDDEAPGGWRDD